MKYLSFAIACALASPGLVLAQEQDIETIEVTGRAMQFYRVDESAMATKTPTNFMDIPQSIQVLSRELIDDQAARFILKVIKIIQVDCVEKWGAMRL